MSSTIEKRAGTEMVKDPIVYLVDDDPLVLESLQASFRFAGFQVHSYSDSATFLQSDIKTNNSCLILDLRMPNMSGVELQQELRNKKLDLPVIIYSGNADIPSTVKAMEIGAVTLIQKPVSTDALISKVRETIHQFQLQQEGKKRYRHAAEALKQLSGRELAIARLVAEGYPATKIAERLYISNRTVEAHKASIFRKLDIKSVANLTQLVLLADLSNSENK